MAAQDFTTYTLTNPNALVSAITSTSVDWSGQTNDNGATYLQKPIPAVTGNFSASFNFDPITSGGFRAAGLFAVQSGAGNPFLLSDSAYVKFRFDGSSLQFILAKRVAGTLTESVVNTYASGSLGTNFDIALDYNSSSNSLGITITPEDNVFSPTSGSISVDLSGFNYLTAFSSSDGSSTSNEWSGSSSGLDFTSEFGPQLSAPASISPGETISFTCSFAPTSVTASDGTSTLPLTNIVNTSGDNYTAVVPALPAVGQSLQYTTFGAVTMSATDGVDTAEDTTTLAAAAGQTVTILAATFDTSELSYLLNFEGTPATGDQFIEGSPQLALDANGGYVADEDGTYEITAIDKTDGIAQTYELIVGPAVSAAGRLTRRNLTRRTLTRRSLTARP